MKSQASNKVNSAYPGGLNILMAVLTFSQNFLYYEQNQTNDSSEIFRYFILNLLDFTNLCIHFVEKVVGDIRKGIGMINEATSFGIVQEFSSSEQRIMWT